MNFVCLLISKNAKVFLASISVLMLIPLYLGSFAYAGSYTTVDNKGMYDYLVEILDRKNFEKTSTINGIEYIQKINVVESDDRVHNVTNNFIIVSKDSTSTVVMNYQLKPTSTGIEVFVSDQPKLKVIGENTQITNVSYSGESYITNLGYASGSFPATIVTEDGGTINNGFLSGSDSYTQNCWNRSTTWSMSFSADTSWQGTYSKQWRNINWEVSGDRVYYEWCIFPFYTQSTKATVSGTGYSNSNTYYGNNAIGPYGWTANDIENPWDDISFKAEFKQQQIP